MDRFSGPVKLILYVASSRFVKVVMVPASMVEGRFVRARFWMSTIRINGFSLRFISEYSPLIFTLNKLFSGVTLNGSCAVPVISEGVAFAVIVKI